MLKHSDFRLKLATLQILISSSDTLTLQVAPVYLVPANDYDGKCTIFRNQKQPKMSVTSYLILVIVYSQRQLVYNQFNHK